MQEQGLQDLAEAQRQVAHLQEELREAHETLDAIRQGEIDAVVMAGSQGHRVYTLETADRPYRVLIERMREGAATLSEAGDVLYCNPYLAELLAAPLEQVTGQRLQRFIQPAYHAAFAALVGLEHGEPMALEMTLLGRDGREIPAKLSVVELPGEPPSPRMMCVVITDLTQVKERARQLGETVQRLREETAVRRAVELDRERLAMLVEESSDFIALADLQGRPQYVNAGGRKLLGLSWPDMVGDPALRDYFTPEQGHRVEGEVLPATAQTGRWSGETELRHFGTGAAIPVILDMFVLMNRDTGRPINLAAIARDMSEQKRIEEQLRQAQKMEAVGQLTGGIAHDFNNLLTGIMGSLELLQTRLGQGRYDTLGRYAGAAVASAGRAAAMTQRLLAFSRRQPLTPQSVDAGALVASMEELLRRTIGPQAALDIVLGTGLWPTRCDPNQLENVLLNLVINARDAMPSGGRIEIACVNVDATDRAVASGRDIAPGQYVAMSVLDTGTGMSAEVMTRAFEPFFTTKPAGQGTGLGLSMIYGFAKQSEGHVRMRSTVGVGTTVLLYLPRSIAPAEIASPEAAARPQHWTTFGETVLVVEDEDAIRALVIEALEDLGLRTIEAADGLAGLRALQSSARIDLLVTDVGLPGLNGRQLAGAARETRPDLKVLFMTGYAEDPLFGSAQQSRIGMITKPFSLDTLQARVRELIQLP